MRLQQLHYDFLLAAETLKAWQAYSLRQRCILFHDAFPDQKLSHRHLAATYRQGGVVHRLIKPGILLS